MRLLRPYIPLPIRLRVALRQIGWLQEEIELYLAVAEELGVVARQLKLARASLARNLGCEATHLHLDHDPALENRPCANGRYSPDANDPEFLLYREAHAHRIKTLVRGDGALRSDAGQRRYLKRVARNRAPEPKRYAGAPLVHHRRWPKRKMQSASRWPTGRRLSP